MTTHDGDLFWVAGRYYTIEELYNYRGQQKPPEGPLGINAFVRMTELTASPVVLIAHRQIQTCTDLDLVRFYRRKIKPGGTWRHRLGLVYNAQLLKPFGDPPPMVFEFPVEPLSFQQQWSQAEWAGINRHFDEFLKTCRSLTTMTEMALTIIAKSGAQDRIRTMVQHLWQHPQVQHVRKVVYSVNDAHVICTVIFSEGMGYARWIQSMKEFSHGYTEALGSQPQLDKRRGRKRGRDSP